MNTQISTKLAALAVALMINSLVIGGVGYLFHVAAPISHGNVSSPAAWQALP